MIKNFNEFNEPINEDDKWGNVNPEDFDWENDDPFNWNFGYEGIRGNVTGWDILNGVREDYIKILESCGISIDPNTGKVAGELSPDIVRAIQNLYIFLKQEEHRSASI